MSSLKAKSTLNTTTPSALSSSTPPASSGQCPYWVLVQGYPQVQANIHQLMERSAAPVLQPLLLGRDHNRAQRLLARRQRCMPRRAAISVSIRMVALQPVRLPTSPGASVILSFPFVPLPAPAGFGTVAARFRAPRLIWLPLLLGCPAARHRLQVGNAPSDLL